MQKLGNHLFLITVKICIDGTKSAMRLLERYVNCVDACMHICIVVLFFKLYFCIE